MHAGAQASRLLASIVVSERPGKEECTESGRVRAHAGRCQRDGIVPRYLDKAAAGAKRRARQPLRATVTPVTHRLSFAKPVPLSRKSAAGYVVSWQGTLLMGIVNVTPDSFSDGGRLVASGEAAEAARRMVVEGAAMVDIGGESTRPGAAPVPAEVECDRVLPVVRALTGLDALISVDTRKAEVAQAALEAGAHLVNDVGGLRDEEMLAVVAGARVPAVIMHMRGTPATMQQQADYQDVASEVFAFLAERAAAALDSGVCGVMLDPGIGFGKTALQNLTLLRELSRLVALGHPVLVGASRKSFIGQLTGEKVPHNRAAGSVAAHLFAAAQGAAALRVHDVALHRQALAVWRELHVAPA